MGEFFRNIICLTGVIICLHLQFLHVAHSKMHAPKRTADLLCTHLLKTQLLEKCCGNSTPSYLLYNSTDCEKYEKDFTACRYECMFKHWNLLDGANMLNMTNVSLMITSLYGKDSGYFSYGEVLKNSFQSCNNLGNIFGDLTSEFNVPLKPYLNVSDFETCNNVAMLYNKCAAAKTFLNCPSANWQENVEECQLGLQVLTNCVNFFNSQSKSERWKPSNKPVHSGATSLRLRQSGLHLYTSFFKWLLF